jgi:hypothetical protein
MKNMCPERHATKPANQNEIRLSGIQIYRQERSGNYIPGFQTDSAMAAVKAFLAERPAFEGGDMHLWNHGEQRICASVKWAVSETALGIPVWHRTDLFYDSLLAMIAQRFHHAHTASKLAAFKYHSTLSPGSGSLTKR